ncbi:MAG TPA: HlyD family efflux transporter periplasmic adaptor subunit [Gemmatimonadales bacterium]|nr:HlyD family efflux transporter periplasmic adaptor subunit [Gemmatimonadales bacterium]
MSRGAKLRPDLVLVEQTYRGEQSYIVKDPATRKYFRFRPVEIMVMQTLDGAHTPTEAAAVLAGEGVRVSPAGIEAFAAKLGGMGLCERTLGERSVLQMERLRAERKRRLSKSVFQGDLMRIRWSVGDPDKLFDRWLPRLRFFFTRTFLVISVALFAVYLLVLGLKWGEFSQALADLYTLNIGAGSLAVLWLTGTVIIVIHELGHGLTCKYFGGQVHEIGAMLIYFEPAFFCNVNDAWTFPDLRARLWVTAAGSWIQLVIASLAAVVWWAAAPGTIISDVAFAAVLIGGVTTVFMNANPLIPLDGYYALSDYLEVPNLRQRAFGHLGWLVKTRLFGLDLPQPPADSREQRVFLIYGALAAAYILLILSFFAATTFGWLTRWLGSLGVVIFMAGLFLTLRDPVRAGLRTARLALRQRQAAWKGRWRTRLGVAGVAVALLGAILPWPITIKGPFVAAPVLSMPLTAPDSGIVHRVHVREGTRVSAGAPLVQIRNLQLERELIASRRVHDSLAARATQARGQSRFSDAAHIDAERSSEAARLAGLRLRVESLRIRALGGGTVVTPRPEELVGRWVGNGATVLELGEVDSIEIRISLQGAGGTQIREGSRARLLPDATLGSPVNVVVTSISAAASPGAVEVRLRLPGQAGWRPGMTGRAAVTVRNSNFWGALWWSIRQGIRTDIFL